MSLLVTHVREVQARDRASLALPQLARRPEDAAKAIGVSRALIYRWRKEGRIKFHKLNGMSFVLETELQRFIAEEFSSDE